eukprot:m.226605 g.226605  ORF g.226605 m.226605 type:complete len:142 (-) comp16991_c0_seq1:161-586(-)
MAAAARKAVKAFFASEKFIVVGASPNREKFGNKVFRALVGRFGAGSVVPVNPTSPEIEGIKTQPLDDLLAAADPAKTAVSVITPPVATLATLQKVTGKGITNIWLQPGAEDAKVVAFAKEHNLVLHSGPCVLVELGVGDHE